MHPRDELVLTLTRIYNYRMTTTSGGNLSILDENGDMWITPSRIDKGCLKPSDIVCVKKDGTIVGPHKPSSEYPFHRAIYNIRPDIKAVIHAHPVNLVAFSCAGKVPNTNITPKIGALNGKVAFAPYGIPGSEDLGAKIAAEFAKGANDVILESHGVCCGGTSLQHTFTRFETVELACRAEIKANMLGKPNYLTDEQVKELDEASNAPFPTFAYKASEMTIAEKHLRNEVCKFAARGYRQGLMTVASGTISVRLDKNSFLITPKMYDRADLLPEDVVLVRDGKCEAGKVPAEEVLAHQAIYAAHPEIGSVINSLPTNSLAFSCCRETIDTRTLPECYIFLREVGMLPYDVLYKDPEAVAKQLSPRHPATVIANNGVMVVGDDLLATFDRLEVLECSAESIMNCIPIGGHIPMGEQVTKDIIKAFNLAE